MRNWGDITEIMTLQIAEKLVNVKEVFGWLGGAVGELLSFASNNWLEILAEAAAAMYAVFKNVFTNIMNFSKAAWTVITNPLANFEFNWTPLLEGYKSALKELPNISGPVLTSLQKDIDAVGERIAGRELKRMQDASEKAKGIAKGTEVEAQRAKVGPEAEQSKGKTKKSETVGLEDFAKKLQEGALAKDATVKTAENTSRMADYLKDIRDARRKAEDKAPGGGMQLMPSVFTNP
jgi:hypothetical protein